MEKRYENIRHVALYLRKSRDEMQEVEDGHIKVLDKHRAKLIEYVEKMGWTYDVYEEIGSSETVIGRPKFIEIIQKIDAGLYDAVVAIHLDRVTKGNRNDVAIISEHFSNANVPVITPDGGFHTFDDEDYITEFTLLSARMGQVRVKNIYRDGKRGGAKVKGHWVNGPAPYAYKYNHATKKLEKNPEQIEVYRFIVDSFLDGMAIWKITQNLRYREVKPPKGRIWHDQTISRILKNQVYLGKVIYGKTKGSGHKKPGKLGIVEKLPEEEWYVSDNAHEPLLTPDEYSQIQIRLAQNERFPVHTQKGKQLLSGLLFCGKCGHAMTCNRRKVKNGTKLYVKKCQSMSVRGEICGNTGINTVPLYKIVMAKISEYDNELKSYRNETEDKKLILVARQIEDHKQILKKLRGANDRTKDMFRRGFIEDIEEFTDLMNQNKAETEKVEKELRALESQYHYKSAEAKHDIQARFEHFKNNFDFENLDTEQANDLLKTIIDKIYYIREGNEVFLDVHFL